MKIRHALESDLPHILPFLAELGYPTSIERLLPRFKQFLKNAGYGLAVCEEHEVILGWVAWSRTDLFVSDVRRFRIEGLFVSPTCRGKGIGKKLMQFVEKTAQENSPAMVDLTSGLHRAKEGAHAFYQHLGYRNEGPKTKIYLRKEYP